MTRLIGYRTEDISGTGNRGLLSVALFEIGKLGNTDIIDFVKNAYDPYVTEENIAGFLKSLCEEGVTECVWVCEKIRDIFSAYPPLHGEEGYWIEKYTFDRGQYRILSDIGSDGKLVAFQSCEVEDMGFVPRSQQKEVCKC